MIEKNAKSAYILQHSCDIENVFFFRFCVFLVYVFLGDSHALIDFVRCIADRNMNGEYVVIAVQDETFDPKNSEKYFRKCKYCPILIDEIASNYRHNKS